VSKFVQKNEDSHDYTVGLFFPLLVPFSILPQFLDADTISPIPGLLALNVDQIQRLSSVAADLPILSLQAIHLVRALQHLIMVLSQELPAESMVSEGLISECLALQRQVPSVYFLNTIEHILVSAIS
jgi:hypothetical protein